MEAEAVHRAAQQPQPAAGDDAGVVGDQRAVQHVEIGLQLLDAGVRRRFADRPACDLDLQHFGRCGEPGIDAGHRETIRLAASVRRGVRRALRQGAQLLRDVGEMRCDRQLGAEHVQLVQIELHHPARLQPQRAAHDVGGDEGVAVTVAADPAAHAQERGELAGGLCAVLLQPVLERVYKPRHLAQEGVVVEGQAVGDLVEHGQLGPAQQIGLPQRQHLAAKLLVAGGRLLRGQRDPLAAVEQAGDLHLAVHGALAADFGRMRGQHRADQRGLEEVAELIGTNARRLGMGQRVRQHAGAAAFGSTRAHLADVVLVLGDVGKVREIAEGTDDPHRLGGRHAVEDLLELAAGEPVLVAVEPDRGLPDALDQVEQFGALLVAHGVAEDAPEQADVVPHARVGLERLDVIRAVGAGFSAVGWYGLEGHGSLLGSSSLGCPASASVRYFSAAVQDELGGGAAGLG